MADTIVIKVELDRGDVKKAVDEIKSAINSAIDPTRKLSSTVIGLSSAFGSIVGIGIVDTIKSLASAAIDAAVKLDKTRQTIAALVGGTDAANKKLIELRRLAAETPGLTANLAASVFAQLKATGEIADATINRLLGSIGKLNAVFSIDQPEVFARNLVQIFTQSFERADIKEALGRVPIFNQILESAFGTNNPDKLRQLQKAGKLTLDAYLQGIANAIANDPRFANIQESIGSQLEKAKDRILVAVAPVGDELLKIFLPVLRDIGEAFEKLGPAAASRLQEISNEIRGVIAATASLIGSIADLASALLSIGGRGYLFDLERELRDLSLLIAAVQDVGELFTAAFLGGLQSIALFIETKLQSALRKFGIEIDSLNKSIDDLRKGFAENDARFDQGFINRDRLLGQFRSEDARRELTQGLSATDRDLLSVFYGDPSLASSTSRSFAPPPPRTGSFKTMTGGGGASKAANAIKRIRDAELSLLREQLDAQVALIKDANDRELKITQDFYDRSLINARQYYDDRLGLTQSSIGAEINQIAQEIKLLESAQLKQAGADRIRSEEELLRLRTRLQIKTNELADAERTNLAEFLKARKQVFDSFRLDLTDQVPVITSGGGNGLPAVTDAALSDVQRRARENLRESIDAVRSAELADLQLRKQELEIQNAVTQGVLSEADARTAILALQREYRDVAIEALRAQAQIEIDPLKLADLEARIASLRTLGLQLSPIESFFKGLNNETETLSEKMERLGQSIRSAFTDAFQTLFEKGPKAFFSSLLNSFKQLLARLAAELLTSQIFRFFSGGLTGGGGGGLGGIGGGGGGGIGGALGSIFGSIFGGGRTAAAGGGGGFSLGGLLGGFGGFGTPPFVPSGGGGAGSLLGSLGSLFGGIGGGGGVNLPIRSTAATGQAGLNAALGAIYTRDLSSIGQIGLETALGANRRGTGFGTLFSSIFSGLKGGFKGIGFGLPSGSQLGGFAAALPLLGLGLGSSLGGQSGLGQILGGVGGGLLGIGLTAAPAALAGLGGLGGLAAGLFSNPVTAIIGGALLVGSFFLGRAKQRRADENTSGDYLQQAIDGIREIKRQVESDQLDGSQAKAIFESQVMGTFIAQINTIKTKSVRESRLTNQTRDLRNLFEQELGPAIAAQKARIKAGTVGAKLIPEFASGGIVPGLDRGYDSVLSRLTPGEMVLTRDQQSRIAAIAGRDVFVAAGVPTAGQQAADGSQAFALGGRVQPLLSRSAEPAAIYLDVTVGLTKNDAQEIFINGAQTDQGQQVIVRSIRRGRAAREI